MIFTPSQATEPHLACDPKKSIGPNLRPCGKARLVFHQTTRSFCLGQKNHLSLHTKGRALETFDPRGSSERSAQGHGGPAAPGGEPPAHPAGRRGVRCRPDVTCGRVLGLRTALSPKKMGRKFGGLGLLKFLKNIPGMGLPGSDAPDFVVAYFAALGRS